MQPLDSDTFKYFHQQEQKISKRFNKKQAFDPELHRKLSHLSGINLNIRNSFTNTSIEKSLGRNNPFGKLQQFRTRNNMLKPSASKENANNVLTTLNSENKANPI